jgi:uncharacterized protein (DUF58 family)
VVEKPQYFDPRTLARLQGLQLRARHIVEGYVAGLHRSPHHGFSIEFAEHREYAPGDDLRYVDWKAFGRTDKYYLKQFEDETNLVCLFLVDVSESMRYRGPLSSLSKLDYACCTVAALAWLILLQQDAVGLVTFDTQVRQFIRPSSHASQLKQFLRVMADITPTSTTATGPVFHELAERVKRRGVIFILSDLFDDMSSLSAGLKHLRHRRHDVVVFHTLDAAELEFPFDRPTRFQGLERLPAVSTDPRALRRAYLDRFQQFREQVVRCCRRQQVEYRLLRTDAPLDSVLARFLEARLARPG